VQVSVRLLARRVAAENREPPPAEDELAKLRATVAKLSPEQLQLLADKFGLIGNEPKSCEELAGGLMTRSAIHLKVKKVLRRLRGRLASGEQRETDQGAGSGAADGSAGFPQSIPEAFLSRTLLRSVAKRGHGFGPAGLGSLVTPPVLRYLSRSPGCR
jgi:hypothetical protein